MKTASGMYQFQNAEKLVWFFSSSQFIFIYIPSITTQIVFTRFTETQNTTPEHMTSQTVARKKPSAGSGS